MNNKEWLKYLSPEERKQYIYNADKYCEKNQFENNWRNEDSDTFESFIDMFRWADTPEGESYWRDIGYEEREPYGDDVFDNIYVDIVAEVVEKDEYFPELLNPLLCN